MQLYSGILGSGRLQEQGATGRDQSSLSFPQKTGMFKNRIKGCESWKIGGKYHKSKKEM